jgi:hypothetical protein
VEDHSGSWSVLGKVLLVAAVSHGWLILVGVGVLITITYIAAIFIVSTLKNDQGNAEFKITTPLLIMTKRSLPDSHNPKRNRLQ